MIDHLKQVIKDKYCQASDTSVDGTVLLKDVDSGMKIKITKPVNDWLVITIPSNHHLGMVQEGNWRKTCDKLILIANGNHIDVYFIEMKKTLKLNQKDIPEDAFMQILSTRPTLEYLASMVKIYFQGQYKIRRHYVVIYEKQASRLDKQRVKPQIVNSYRYRRETFKCILFVSYPIDLQHLPTKNEKP